MKTIGRSAMPSLPVSVTFFCTVMDVPGPISTLCCPLRNDESYYLKNVAFLFSKMIFQKWAVDIDVQKKLDDITHINKEKWCPLPVMIFLSHSVILLSYSC